MLTLGLFFILCSKYTFIDPFLSFKVGLKCILVQKVGFVKYKSGPLHGHKMKNTSVVSKVSKVVFAPLVGLDMRVAQIFLLFFCNLLLFLFFCLPTF